MRRGACSSAGFPAHRPGATPAARGVDSGSDGAILPAKGHGQTARHARHLGGNRFCRHGPFALEVDTMHPWQPHARPCRLAVALIPAFALAWAVAAADAVLAPDAERVPLANPNFALADREGLPEG